MFLEPGSHAEFAQRGGRRDWQSRVVLGYVEKVVKNLLVRYDRSAGAGTWSPQKAWIQPGSIDDPRVYLTARAEVPEIDGTGFILADPRILADPHRRATKARKDAFATFIAERITGESQSAWRRDVHQWIAGKKVITPEKVRRLCVALGASWVEELLALRYLQHLVSFVAWLLDRDRAQEATAVGALTFSAWARASDPEMPLLHAACKDAVGFIERGVGSDYVIAGRVDVAKIKQDELRAAFRICDPADAQLLKGGPRAYPASAVRKAASQLISDAIAGKLGVDDPFEPATLLAILEKEAKP